MSMLTLLAATAMLAAPQTFESLAIDLPVTATQAQAMQGRKVWEALDVQTFAGGQKAVNHGVTIAITDFAALESKPTPEQMLDLHEQNFRRRAGYSNVFARRTEGKAGTSKALMFYGYGQDAQGNAKTLASAVFVKSLKLYEVIWATSSHLRKVPLSSLSKIKFDGAPVTGWTSSLEGEYSMNGFPFAVFSKQFIGVEMVKPDRGYAEGFFASTLTGEAVADTRFVAVRLKPGDKRTDRELFKDLAALVSAPFTADDKVPDIVAGAAEKTMEFEDAFGSTVAARVVFLHKGSYVGLLSVSGDKSPALLAELKKPTLKYTPLSQ